MKSRALSLFGLILLLALSTTAALGQSLNDQASANRVQEKLRKIELLNLLLPVLVTKEQASALLPVVKAARRADEDLKKKEVNLLKTLEPELDASIKAGLEKGQVPANPFMDKINLHFTAMVVARKSMIETQMELVMAEVNKQFDAGQKKAAGGLVTKLAVNPAKPDEVTDDMRLRHWVKTVLLDPLMPDMLLRISIS